MSTHGPHYPLKYVKKLIRAGDYYIKPNAQQSARDDFNWGPEEIKRCLLKLNERYFGRDQLNNHFYKSEPHRHIPNTIMDYYKAGNIMQGFDIYTHFYVRPSDGKLIISSFKELEK